ncbi:MBL fold metallo-hydrolase [Streptomyces sp. NPDC056821]|uniref:MBL fold metallo-hydrolase n=1 Tax=unclassified Streptomyces TaxID=2593676 RepID=UPI0036C19E34
MSTNGEAMKNSNSDAEVMAHRLSQDLPRVISEGVTWIGACLPFVVDGQVIHGHNSTFLVQGTEASVLVDTGAPSSWWAIEEVLDRILGDRPLTYLFATHPELPHTGNMPRLVEKYPGLRVIGDVRDYHLFYPEVVPNLHAKVPGDRIDLGGGHEFVLVEAMIRDLPNTLWGFATRARTLFTADGFCYMHRPELDDEDPAHLPGECGLTTGELRQPIAVENAAFFTGSALYFSRFVDDSDERYERVADLAAELGAEIVCPTHGNVITDLDDVLPIVRAGHKQAYRF